jgi:hypothetical protein
MDPWMLKSKGSRDILAAVAVAVAVTVALCSCDKGDGFGPVERTARALLNGWDMWQTEAVKPYQPPLLPVPAGTVQLGGVQGYEWGYRELLRLPEKQRQERARLAYRRYCHHCHGPHGDGRIIVGESLAPASPDLRLPPIQSKSDKELFERVARGGGTMIPLNTTMTPLEILSAISHVRGLIKAPSTPFFQPRSLEPIR